jgi:Homing endonuclease associated repeat
MTKDRILRGIKSCAKKLKRAPSYTELQRTMKVTRRAVIKHFGSYTAAVQACGLEREGSGHPVAMEALFKDWAGVARKIGKLPTVAQYERHGRFSVQPLFTRFGNWRQTPVGMMLYAQEHGLEEEWRDVLDMVKGGAVKGPGTAGKRFIAENGKAGAQAWKPGQGKIMKDRPTYGRPIVDGPLANEPDNEQAVVFLFGAMAEKLGFVAVKVRTAYPMWRRGGR